MAGPYAKGSTASCGLLPFHGGHGKKKRTTGVKKHGALLAKLAQEEIDRWKEEVPPASPLAFRREEEDIQKALKISCARKRNTAKRLNRYGWNFPSVPGPNRGAAP